MNYKLTFLLFAIGCAASVAAAVSNVGIGSAWHSCFAVVYGFAALLSLKLWEEK